MAAEKAKEKIKDPCLVCNDTVARKTGGVQCNFCELWAHPKCVKISVQHLRALAEQPGMTWTCERCRTLSMKLQKQIQALNCNQQLMDERISKNTDAIAENKNSIQT
ncbi:MAG: hypothetical protein GY696_19850 [Gammaproteobacteria bacterium]|nr:hypothetical protein [Gammaproteobacteria bacterium]